MNGIDLKDQINANCVCGGESCHVVTFVRNVRVSLSVCRSVHLTLPSIQDGLTAGQIFFKKARIYSTDQPAITKICPVITRSCIL